MRIAQGLKDNLVQLILSKLSSKIWIAYSLNDNRVQLILFITLVEIMFSKIEMAFLLHDNFVNETPLFLGFFCKMA
jgi:hypothetical protein